MSVNASISIEKPIMTGNVMVFSTNLGWMGNLMLSGPALQAKNSHTVGINSQNELKTQIK